jgi:hypothetical protein
MELGARLMKKGPDRIEPGRDLQLSNPVGGYQAATTRECYATGGL